MVFGQNQVELQNFTFPDFRRGHRPDCYPFLDFFSAVYEAQDEVKTNRVTT